MIGHYDEVTDVRYLQPSADTERLVVSTNSHDVYVVDPVTRGSTTLAGHTDIVLAIDIAPDQSAIATASKVQTQEKQGRGEGGARKERRGREGEARKGERQTETEGNKGGGDRGRDTHTHTHIMWCSFCLFAWFACSRFDTLLRALGGAQDAGCIVWAVDGDNVWPAFKCIGHTATVTSVSNRALALRMAFSALQNHPNSLTHAHTHTHTHSLTLTHTHSYTHTHTHTHSHSPPLPPLSPFR